MTYINPRTTRTLPAPPHRRKVSQPAAHANSELPYHRVPSHTITPTPRCNSSPPSFSPSSPSSPSPHPSPPYASSPSPTAAAPGGSRPWASARKPDRMQQRPRQRPGVGGGRAGRAGAGGCCVAGFFSDESCNTNDVVLLDENAGGRGDMW